MYYVLSKWLIQPKIGGITIYDYLEDEAATQNFSDGFSRKSNVIFKGIIGALGGRLVRIIQPSYWRDGILYITAFFSRKIVYALNV